VSITFVDDSEVVFRRGSNVFVQYIAENNGPNPVECNAQINTNLFSSCVSIELSFTLSNGYWDFGHRSKPEKMSSLQAGVVIHSSRV
jgi:hypothetical protein